MQIINHKAINLILHTHFEHFKKTENLQQVKRSHMAETSLLPLAEFSLQEQPKTKYVKPVQMPTCFTLLILFNTL